MTSIRLFYLPVKYANIEINIESEDYYSVEEAVAWLEGKAASREGVMKCLGVGNGCYSFDGLLADTKVPTPPLPVDDLLTLVANDGGEVKEDMGVLRRRFQFIDDFLSDFPDERRLVLPFPRKVIRASVFCQDLPLVEVDACLCHLNPHSAMWYLYFDTKGAGYGRLLEIARMCKEDEVSSVISKRAYNSDPPLRNNGLGVNFLAHILEVHRDSINAAQLLSTSPSFLTCFYHQVGDWERFSELVLTADYRSVRECRLGQGSVNRDVSFSILARVLPIVETKEQAERILDMVYPRKDSLVISPFPDSGQYDLTAATRTRYTLIAKSTISRVALLLGLSEEELIKRTEGSQ